MAIKKEFSFLFILILTTIKAQSTSLKNTTIFNNDLIIEGELLADSLTVNKFESKGTVRSQEVTLKKISANQLKTKKLQVETIIPKSGNLVINGNVILKTEISGNNINIEGHSNLIQGQEQWSLIKYDDFETEESLNGWSDKRVNHFQEDEKNNHLGGKCNFAGNKVTKVFSNLPKHKILRINALYHMIDNWNGEEGYMLVDGVKKWSKKGKVKAGPFSKDPKNPDYNIKIDVIVEHTDDSVEISFGSTIFGDPCDQSFGVDDVMIYTK